MSVIYDELKELARGHLSRERAGHTLRPTELVHEVYLKLSRNRQNWWENRGQFFAIASRTIRRILTNHAQARATQKRGGGRTRVTLTDKKLASTSREVDFLALDEALENLFRLDERQGRIVELKFFGGLTNNEVAEVLGVSPRTVSGEWALARSWIRFHLDPEGSKAS